ncbi:MAG: AAA family ATPase [Sedimenticola sp.]
MIITDISARDVLKYDTLELGGLPESGVIAIGGPNESGKSTIGETICFALFGRTYSLEPAELEKLIRWGENRCSVNIRFRVNDDNHYEVARFLDRDGNHGVRLNLVDDHDNPIAKGVEDVDNAIYEILGYGYDEFIESFYLAQREITTPHPHSYAVKAMAGLSSLEYVDYEFEEEVRHEELSISELDHEIADIDQELEDLAIDPGQLNVLESEREKLSASETELQAEIEALEADSTAYQEAVPKIRSATSARGRARFLRFISLILALVAGAAWGLLVRMPEHAYAQQLEGILQQNIPQWGAHMVPWLLYGAIGFAILFILFMIRAGVLNSRINRLMTTGTALSERLSAIHQAVPASEQEDVPDEGDESETQRPGDSEIATICQRISVAEASPSEMRDSVGREMAWMRRERQQQQERLITLDQEIWNEKDRLSKAEKLNDVEQALEQKMEEHRQRIRQRELASELIAGATKQLSQNFNRDLRDLVGRTLPMFTENRYEHLQIDDDLSVRVFSNEKRDFMDLEEISSGTQRQIMLAVRLALSQELVNSTVVGKQFIFLDEPFAFFDQERTRSSLGVLPNLSDEITQVWIVAQEYPDGHRFDLPINCDRSQQTMSVQQQVIASEPMVGGETGGSDQVWLEVDE